MFSTYHSVATTMDREPVSHHWHLRFWRLSFELSWQLPLGARLELERREDSALIGAALDASDRETVVWALEDHVGDRETRHELLRSIIAGTYVSPYGAPE